MLSTQLDPQKSVRRPTLMTYTNDLKRINLSIRSSVQSRAYAQPTDSSKHHGHDQIGSELKKVARTRSANPDTIENVQQPTKRPPPSIDTESEQIASQLKKATIGEDEPDRPTAPNVAAAFRTPYKHTPQHGIPVAQLQLRSYSVRNLEVMAEFALRVAYYLKLAATGPAPLPRRIERWTTIRSNFVHKKSQENFERITMKRLITVYDGHPDVVELWLACLRKWQFYGVGMKANVWSFEELGKSCTFWVEDFC